MIQTKSRQDYLKAVYELLSDRKRVSTQDIAKRLRVKSSSVTGMLKNLTREKLISHSPHKGACLTAGGRSEALRLRRRHGLIEIFLSRVLKMDMAEVHKEAEALEHHISDRLEELIDRHLEHPKYSINGEPIPDREGHVPENKAMPIEKLKPSQKGIICEVVDRCPAQIERWKELGLVLGAKVTIEEDRSIDGIVILIVDGNKIPITWRALHGLKVIIQGRERRK